MANSFDEIKEALSNIKTEDFKWADKTGIIAQETSDVLNDTITIDTTSLWNTTGSYNIGIGAAGSYLYNGSNGSSMWSTAVGTNTPSLSVSGNAEFDQDIKVKGISVLKTLEEINRRLAILVPDPAKLEHFEALKKAYEHYKTLEALCTVPKKEDAGK